LATLSALAQGANIDYDKIQIITQKLAPNFYALTGSPDLDPGHPEAAGGRVGILIGPEGVFLVDGTFAPLSGKVLEAIKKANPGPIRFLVDTHYHPDHTGGNPNFARMEAIIFAREVASRERVRSSHITQNGQPCPEATEEATAHWIVSFRQVYNSSVVLICTLRGPSSPHLGQVNMPELRALPSNVSLLEIAPQ
jgi:cyclase